MNYLVDSILIGTGATALMDVWGLARKPLLGVAVPDYAPVGRWLAGMRRGQFRHAAIAKLPSVNGELLIGWTAHYLTGIAFAAVLLVAAGPAWLQQPAPGPALLLGIVTLVVPFLVMQPAMGAGIAAARTPRPNTARLQSVLTHTVFGIGLYLAAVARLALIPA